jgi:hypothetical protein
MVSVNGNSSPEDSPRLAGRYHATGTRTGVGGANPDPLLRPVDDDPLPHVPEKHPGTLHAPAAGHLEDRLIRGVGPLYRSATQRIAPPAFYGRIRDTSPRRVWRVNQIIKPTVDLGEDGLALDLVILASLRPVAQKLALVSIQAQKVARPTLLIDVFQHCASFTNLWHVSDLSSDRWTTADLVVGRIEPRIGRATAEVLGTRHQRRVATNLRLGARGIKVALNDCAVKG